MLYLVVIVNVSVPCKRADTEAWQFSVAALLLCDAGPGLVSHEPRRTGLPTGEPGVAPVRVPSVVASVAMVAVVVSVATSNALFGARNPHLTKRCQKGSLEF